MNVRAYFRLECFLSVYPFTFQREEGDDLHHFHGVFVEPHKEGFRIIGLDAHHVGVVTDEKAGFCSEPLVFIPSNELAARGFRLQEQFTGNEPWRPYIRITDTTIEIVLGSVTSDQEKGSVLEAGTVVFTQNHLSQPAPLPYPFRQALFNNFLDVAGYPAMKEILGRECAIEGLPITEPVASSSLYRLCQAVAVRETYGSMCGGGIIFAMSEPFRQKADRPFTRMIKARLSHDEAPGRFECRFMNMYGGDDRVEIETF